MGQTEGLLEGTMPELTAQVGNVFQRVQQMIQKCDSTVGGAGNFRELQQLLRPGERVTRNGVICRIRLIDHPALSCPALPCSVLASPILIILI